MTRLFTDYLQIIYIARKQLIKAALMQILGHALLEEQKAKVLLLTAICSRRITAQMRGNEQQGEGILFLKNPGTSEREDIAAAWFHPTCWVGCARCELTRFYGSGMLPFSFTQ